MAKKWYGNLNNRLDEGKNFTEDKIIKEDTDITMYYWSDRYCYWVTKVVDQKHIFVKEYQVCADHSKPGGQGHQNWLYFKTRKEEAEYLKKYFPETETNVTESKEEEWVFRYNKWNSVDRWDMASICEYEKINGHRPYFTPEEEVKLLDGKEICRYHKLQPISFGVRDYYYDWEF